MSVEGVSKSSIARIMGISWNTVARWLERAAMAAVIIAIRQGKGAAIGTGEAYDAYKKFCQRAGLRPLTGRAVGDLLSELDIYSLIRTRVVSRGRYGRTREIVLDLPGELVGKIQESILLAFGLRRR